MNKLKLSTLNGTVSAKLGVFNISFDLNSVFSVHYKDTVLFHLKKEEINQESENLISTSQDYLLAGLMIWLKRIGHDYIFELAKLTTDKKPEEIQVPVAKTTAPKKTVRKTKPTVSPLRNKVVVFSGFRDSTMERLIIQKGGYVANSIGYSTDYLVIPDELNRGITTKITKANRFGVEIKRRSQFLLLINK